MPLRSLLARLSLRQRLNGAILLTFLLIALMFSAIFIPLKQHTLDTAKQKAQVLLKTLVARDREALANEIFERQVRATVARLQEMRKAEGVLAIIVFDAQGRSMVTVAANAAMANDAQVTLDTAASDHMLSSRWQGQSALRLVQAIDLLGQRIGFIDIYYSLEEIEQEQQGFLFGMAGMLATVLLAMMGLLNYVLTRGIIHPISTLRIAMHQVEAGELGSQVTVQGRDEVGELSRSFNRMSLELKRAIDGLAQINAELEERIAQRTAHLNTSLEQLQTTQHQLIQQEKMASLGQLVASVAHEINTPIAAVASSGRSGADALSHALHQLPALYAALTAEQTALFNALLARANQRGSVLSSREERQFERSLMQWLEQAGVAEAHRRANMLVQCQVREPDPGLLPLLQHAEAELIIDTAYNIAVAVGSIANINMAAERVAKIVFALKKFSRIDDSGLKQKVALQDGIETVLTLYHNKIKDGVELRRKFAPLPEVPCFADELNQVWTNLIHNALQAMDYRGTLSISTSQVGDQAVVTIKDSGAGMDEETKARIFEPFFTTKRAGEGSGLGLDIVRKIVERHQGRIEVDSQPGLGATFRVFLPLTAAD